MSVACKYTGSFGDYSGYGSANRAFVAALHLAGASVTTEFIHQVRDKTEFGWIGKLAESLEGRVVPYKIKIIHLTPDIYPDYMEKGKYHIGHLFWETTKLPKEWIPCINKMGEIWTSSKSMVELMKNSGPIIIPL